MTSLLELAQRVEAAEGPDRGLDALISAMQIRAISETRFKTVQAWADTAIFNRWNFPHYTSSLDAAMQLVPERWRLDHLGEKRIVPGFIATVSPKMDIDGDAFGGEAATPALALTAACLRAKAGGGLEVSSNP